jgi:hypothetical protein
MSRSVSSFVRITQLVKVPLYLRCNAYTQRAFRRRSSAGLHRVSTQLIGAGHDQRVEEYDGAYLCSEPFDSDTGRTTC